MSNSNKISADWQDRETLQKVQLHIMTIVDFLNRFGTFDFSLFLYFRYMRTLCSRCRNETIILLPQVQIRRYNIDLQIQKKNWQDSREPCRTFLSCCVYKSTRAIRTHTHTTSFLSSPDSWKHQLNSQHKKNDESIFHKLVKEKS